MNSSHNSTVTKPRLGKRGKGRYTADKGLRDAYKFYLERFVEQAPLTKFSDPSQRTRPMAYKDFKRNAHMLLEKLMDKILVNSETLTLPYNLGLIRVIKKKMPIGVAATLQNTLKINWGHYQKTGKIIRHLNENRDYYRYGFYWLCKRGPRGKNLYKFQASRTNKRRLAQLLKTTNIDYFE
jgi:hypothetical protein